MTLTREEVQHIAALARLDLTADEIERYRKQLSDILDYADRLQGVDTSQVSPTASLLTSVTALREDVARPGLTRAQLLGNAPDTDAGQFRVPPVLE